MSWTIYGILIVFGAFVLLMMFNPRLSCFGKRITSPLYPLLRKKKKQEIKTEDYGFHLAEGARPKNSGVPSRNKWGLTPREASTKGPAKPVKTVDYGFHLVDAENKDKRTKEGGGNKEEES